MPSSIIDSVYYKDMFGTAAMRAVFSDERRFTSWLETEVALARSEARVGLIPASAAEQPDPSQPRRARPEVRLSKAGRTVLRRFGPPDSASSDGSRPGAQPTYSLI